MLLAAIAIFDHRVLTPLAADNFLPSLCFKPDYSYLCFILLGVICCEKLALWQTIGCSTHLHSA
jgi:hypothetical protein